MEEDRVSVLLYADGVLAMSESVQEYQELIEVVNEYGGD